MTSNDYAQGFERGRAMQREGDEMPPMPHPESPRRDFDRGRHEGWRCAQREGLLPDGFRQLARLLTLDACAIYAQAATLKRSSERTTLRSRLTEMAISAGLYRENATPQALATEALAVLLEDDVFSAQGLADLAAQRTQQEQAA